MLLQRRHHFAVMFRAWEILGGYDHRGEAQPAGRLDAGGIRPVGDHDRDLSVRDLARRHVASEGLEVGAASGEENAEVVHDTAAVVVSRKPRRLLTTTPHKLVFQACTDYG